MLPYALLLLLCYTLFYVRDVIAAAGVLFLLYQWYIEQSAEMDPERPLLYESRAHPRRRHTQDNIPQVQPWETTPDPEDSLRPEEIRGLLSNEPSPRRRAATPSPPPRPERLIRSAGARPRSDGIYRARRAISVEDVDSEDGVVDYYDNASSEDEFFLATDFSDPLPKSNHSQSQNYLDGIGQETRVSSRLCVSASDIRQHESSSLSKDMSDDSLPPESHSDCSDLCPSPLSDWSDTDWRSRSHSLYISNDEAGLTLTKRSHSDTNLLHSKSLSSSMLALEMDMEEIDCHESFRDKIRGVLGLHRGSPHDTSLEFRSPHRPTNEMLHQRLRRVLSGSMEIPPTQVKRLRTKSVPTGVQEFLQSTSERSRSVEVLNHLGHSSAFQPYQEQRVIDNEEFYIDSPALVDYQLGRRRTPPEESVDPTLPSADSLPRDNITDSEDDEIKDALDQPGDHYQLVHATPILLETPDSATRRRDTVHATPIILGSPCFGDRMQAKMNDMDTDSNMTGLCQEDVAMSRSNLPKPLKATHHEAIPGLTSASRQRNVSPTKLSNSRQSRIPTRSPSKIAQHDQKVALKESPTKPEKRTFVSRTRSVSPKVLRRDKATDLTELGAKLAMSASSDSHNSPQSNAQGDNSDNCDNINGTNASLFSSSLKDPIGYSCIDRKPNNSKGDNEKQETREEPVVEVVASGFASHCHSQSLDTFRSGCQELDLTDDEGPPVKRDSLTSDQLTTRRPVMASSWMDRLKQPHPQQPQDLDNDDEWMSDEEEMEFEREQQARMRQRPQSPSSDEEPARPPSDMSSSDDEGFTYQRSDANRRTGGGQPPNMQEPGQAEMDLMVKRNSLYLNSQELDQMDILTTDLETPEGQLKVEAGVGELIHAQDIHTNSGDSFDTPEHDDQQPHETSGSLHVVDDSHLYMNASMADRGDVDTSGSDNDSEPGMRDTLPVLDRLKPTKQTGIQSPHEYEEIDHTVRVTAQDIHSESRNLVVMDYEMPQKKTGEPSSRRWMKALAQQYDDWVDEVPKLSRHEPSRESIRESLREPTREQTRLTEEELRERVEDSMQDKIRDWKNMTAESVAGRVEEWQSLGNFNVSTSGRAAESGPYESAQYEPDQYDSARYATAQYDPQESDAPSSKPAPTRADSGEYADQDRRTNSYEEESDGEYDSDSSSHDTVREREAASPQPAAEGAPVRDREYVEILGGEEPPDEWLNLGDRRERIDSCSSSSSDGTGFQYISKPPRQQPDADKQSEEQQTPEEEEPVREIVEHAESPHSSPDCIEVEAEHLPSEPRYSPPSSPRGLPRMDCVESDEGVVSSEDEMFNDEVEMIITRTPESCSPVSITHTVESCSPVSATNSLDLCPPDRILHSLQEEDESSDENTERASLSSTNSELSSHDEPLPRSRSPILPSKQTEQHTKPHSPSPVEPVASPSPEPAHEPVEQEMVQPVKEAVKPENGETTPPITTRNSSYDRVEKLRDEMRSAKSLDNAARPSRSISRALSAGDSRPKATGKFSEVFSRFESPNREAKESPAVKRTNLEIERIAQYRKTGSNDSLKSGDNIKTGSRPSEALKPNEEKVEEPVKARNIPVEHSAPPAEPEPVKHREIPIEVERVEPIHAPTENSAAVEEPIIEPQTESRAKRLFDRSKIFDTGLPSKKGAKISEKLAKFGGSVDSPKEKAPPAITNRNETTNRFERFTHSSMEEAEKAFRTRNEPQNSQPQKATMQQSTSRQSSSHEPQPHFDVDIMIQRQAAFSGEVNVERTTPQSDHTMNVWDTNIPVRDGREKVLMPTRLHVTHMSKEVPAQSERVTAHAPRPSRPVSRARSEPRRRAQSDSHQEISITIRPQHHTVRATVTPDTMVTSDTRQTSSVLIKPRDGLSDIIQPTRITRQSQAPQYQRARSVSPEPELTRGNSLDELRQRPSLVAQNKNMFSRPENDVQKYQPTTAASKAYTARKPEPYNREKHGADKERSRQNIQAAIGELVDAYDQYEQDYISYDRDSLEYTRKWVENNDTAQDYPERRSEKMADPVKDDVALRRLQQNNKPIGAKHYPTASYLTMSSASPAPSISDRETRARSTEPVRTGRPARRARSLPRKPSRAIAQKANMFQNEEPAINTQRPPLNKGRSLSPRPVTQKERLGLENKPEQSNKGVAMMVELYNKNKGDRSPLPDVDEATLASVNQSMFSPEDACVVDTAPLSQNAWNKWHGSGSENGSSEVRIERSYPKPESSASAPPVRKSSVNPKLMTGGWQPHKGEEKPSHVAFSPPRPAKPESVRLAAERKDWTPSPAAPAAPAVPQRRYDEAETRDLAPYNGYTEPQSAFDIYKQQSLQRFREEERDPYTTIQKVIQPTQSAPPRAQTFEEALLMQAPPPKPDRLYNAAEPWEAHKPMDYPTTGSTQDNWSRSNDPRQAGYQYNPPKQNSYPANQPGYSNQPHGYPGKQQSYANNQQKYPNSQTAYPASQPGYPNNQQGYTTNQRGYPSNQQGYPSNQQGYPSNQGYPTNQQSYPSNNYNAGRQNYPNQQPYNGQHHQASQQNPQNYPTQNYRQPDHSQRRDPYPDRYDRPDGRYPDRVTSPPYRNGHGYPEPIKAAYNPPQQAAYNPPQQAAYPPQEDRYRGRNRDAHPQGRWVDPRIDPNVQQPYHKDPRISRRSEDPRFDGRGVSPARDSRPRRTNSVPNIKQQVSPRRDGSLPRRERQYRQDDVQTDFTPIQYATAKSQRLHNNNYPTEMDRYPYHGDFPQYNGPAYPAQHRPGVGVIYNPVLGISDF